MNKFQFLKSLIGAIIDSFDRSNSTNSLGNTDTGQTWTNSVIYGNALGINSNSAYSASSVDAAAVVEANKANGTLSMVVGTVRDYIALVARYADANNYCMCEYNSYAGGKIAVFGKVSGSAFGGYDAAGYYVSASIANGDTVKVVMSGTSFTIYVNGVSKGTLTITQNSTATKHGIKLYGTLARIASFRFDY